ncbi:MAG: hypothetical protein HRU09_07440 [Oligoflexales bacterium]|nr:hypothetical protein [Oligoflexales bacterium]
MAPLGILLKLLVPLLGFYLVQKWIKNALNPTQNYSGNPEERHTSAGGKSADDIIDICPDCGNVKQKNHKCQYKSDCEFNA